MQDIISQIKAHLHDPSLPVTREWVDEVVREYPYFNLPAVLYLKQHGTQGNDDLLGRVAITSPSRASLAMSVDNEAAALAHFYPSTSASTSTTSAIDRFLDTYGDTNPRELEALQAAIFNPTPDYADVLMAQERAEHQQQATQPAAQSAQDRMIADFIEQSRQREQHTPPVEQPHVQQTEAAEVAQAPIGEAPPPDEGMLSESLAKMYIARGKYAKALEIIESIYLKYPEKSCYFADQIRFLRKLVLNQSAAKHKKQ